MHTFTDNRNIICFLLRTIRDTDTTGKVNKGHAYAGLLLYFNRKLEQCLCKRRIIIIRYRIAYQEGMNTKALYALAL